MRSIVVFIISLSLLLAACHPQSASLVPEALLLVQEKNSISASLTAMMTFNDHGTILISPTECSVQDVPLNWTGNVFVGAAYEGTDERVICAVRGTVSADGAWIENLEFSRQTAVQPANGIDFKVTVRGIPIAGPYATDPAIVGFFEKTGDGRKHIKSLECSHSELTYLSTQWEGEGGLTSPTLQIRLEKVTIKRPDAPVEPGAGCPCEW
jgi:hypothetical protein